MSYYFMPLSFLIVILAGCSPQLTGSPPSTSAHKAVDANKSVASSNHTVKPGAPVRLENSGPYRLQQGSSTDIQLVLLANASDGVMDVRITVSDDLILNTTSTVQFQLSPQARYELPIHITAQQQGRYYINLQVSTRINQRESTRVLSAIVQVGDELQLQKNQGSMTSSAAGDDVVSMPAQETIIP